MLLGHALGAERQRDGDRCQQSFLRQCDKCDLPRASAITADQVHQDHARKRFFFFFLNSNVLDRLVREVKAVSLGTGTLATMMPIVNTIASNTYNETNVKPTTNCRNMETNVSRNQSGESCCGANVVNA